MQTEERRSLAELLYPWYKEEVFRRRAHMAWLTGLAVTALLALLAYVTLAPRHPEGGHALRLFLIPGVLLFSGLTAYLILQQRDRHRQAKQVLIELERELNLFDKDESCSGKALYPTEWQTAWLRDSSVIVYLSAIGAMSLLAIAALFTR
jgi:hypothetical protein